MPKKQAIQTKIRSVRLDRETDEALLIGAKNEGTISAFFRKAVAAYWQIKNNYGATNENRGCDAAIAAKQEKNLQHDGEPDPSVRENR